MADDKITIVNKEEQIIQLRKEGKTYQEIGDIFKISRQRIHQIVNYIYIPSPRKILPPHIVKERRKKYQRQYKLKRWHETRLKVLTHYGGNPPKCSHCGFNNYKVLELDHINNNGADERKKFKSTYQLYFWIVRNNYPAGYQILCRNCNWLKYLKLSQTLTY